MEASPTEPVTPRPAATLALLRQGPGDIEILLLKRSPRTRFIPGAFVFPGGRLDPEDGSPEMLALASGPSPLEAHSPSGAATETRRLDVFRVAALRETFEEAGVLLGEGGPRSLPLEEQGETEESPRYALREGHRPFHSILASMGERLNNQSLRLFGHWITPVRERYRYDTRFFGAIVPVDFPAFPDGEEMVEALWLTPAEALHRNRNGSLPMVFPTIVSLQALLPFTIPEEALDALSTEKIRPILPTVEDTGEGIQAVFNEAP